MLKIVMTDEFKKIGGNVSYESLLEREQGLAQLLLHSKHLTGT